MVNWLMKNKEKSNEVDEISLFITHATSPLGL